MSGNKLSGRATLSEIFGSKGEEFSSGKAHLSMDDLKELLGDGMPKIRHTQGGKLRLVRALQQRFGDNYRNIPGIESFLTEFDDDIKHKMTVAKLKIRRMDKEDTEGMRS
jgi:hypothetical protein